MKTLFVLFGAMVWATATAPAPLPFIVHEWGTFTTVAGADGVALEWRPFAGEDDLPAFVYGVGDLADGAGVRHNARVKASLDALVRMETPVLYFYANHELDVSVRVDFPQGKITEWYPQARSVAAGIDWGRVRVMPGAMAPLPTADGRSRYFAARETDAALVRVCGDGRTQFEKFLFYRGVGSFRLPVTAALDGEQVRFVNAGAQEVPAFVVFENEAGQTRFEIHGPVRGELVVTRPAQAGSVETLGAELVKILCGQGLYEREAAAMVETWRDSWFEEGLRVFYLVPRAVTDEILPLTLDPKPDELVRVLVGRIELFPPDRQAKILANPEQYRRFAEAVRNIQTTSVSHKP